MARETQSLKIFGQRFCWSVQQSTLTVINRSLEAWWRLAGERWKVLAPARPLWLVQQKGYVAWFVAILGLVIRLRAVDNIVLHEVYMFFSRVAVSSVAHVREKLFILLFLASTVFVFEPRIEFFLYHGGRFEGLYRLISSLVNAFELRDWFKCESGNLSSAFLHSLSIKVAIFVVYVDYDLSIARATSRVQTSCVLLELLKIIWVAPLSWLLLHHVRLLFSRDRKRYLGILILDGAKLRHFSAKVVM